MIHNSLLVIHKCLLVKFLRLFSASKFCKGCSVQDDAGEARWFRGWQSQVTRITLLWFIPDRLTLWLQTERSAVDFLPVLVLIFVCCTNTFVYHSSARQELLPMLTPPVLDTKKSNLPRTLNIMHHFIMFVHATTALLLWHVQTFWYDQLNTIWRQSCQ